MCSNIYDQTFSILHFLCGFGFSHTHNKSNKVRSKQNNAYTEMHDAKMHNNEASIHEWSYKNQKN